METISTYKIRHGKSVIDGYLRINGNSVLVELIENGNCTSVDFPFSPSYFRDAVAKLREDENLRSRFFKEAVFSALLGGSHKVLYRNDYSSR